MAFITTIISMLARTSTVPAGVPACIEAERDDSGLRLYVDGNFEGWIDGVVRL